MSHTLRLAVPGDAAPLTELAWRAKAHWGYPPAWLSAWRAQLTVDASYLAEHRVLVAERAGVPVGMCALEDHGSWWVLEHVWVDPAGMGQGIGRVLVEDRLTLAWSLRPGRVLVEADPHAGGFYRRLGARQVGKVPAAMPGVPDRVLPIFEFGPATA
jgi:GNAT superfamily N-acetyltransferase